MTTVPLVLAVFLVAAAGQETLPSPPPASAEPQVEEAAEEPPQRPVDSMTGRPEKAAEEPAAKPTEKRNPPASASADGFLIQSESGDFRLQVRGYVQLDGRFYAGDETGAGLDSFVLRRARPIVQGAAGKYFEFNITPDFEGGTAILQDAWGEFKPSVKLRVRVGKYKAPVGLERLQSATAVHFVERAFPTALVPNRDVGIQLHGELSGGSIAYAVGLFDGAPDGGSVDTDLNDGKDLAGRLFIAPFTKGESVFKGLGFGIAGTTGRQSGPLPDYRSGGQITIVSPNAGVTADGVRQRFSPQLSFYAGPFGLLAEYAKSRWRARRADASRGTFTAQAWQVTATVCFTGDKPAFAGLRPLRPFDPARGQWGALELAVRVDGIELGGETIETGLVDPARSVRDAFAWAVGLSWSLTRNVKQIVDYERTTFTGGAAGGRDRDPENAVFIRSQISF